MNGTKAKESGENWLSRHLGRNHEEQVIKAFHRKNKAAR